jgi:hypothetical protein
VFEVLAIRTNLIKKIMTAFLLVVLAIVVLGAIYQQLAEMNDRASIPGDMVSLDGKEIHVLCVGTGEPTVMLENGTWGSYPDWHEVMNTIKARTRICSYDRLGIGWSSKNGAPIGAAEIV